jgi:hypothetical protein
MSETTPSGWPVLEPGSRRLTRLDVAGTQFVVAAEVAPALEWLTRFLHAVEPVDEAGWDGGYAHRKIAGTDRWSVHAAGTAIDWNASQHGRTGHPNEGWSATQSRCIRWMLTHTLRGGYFVWGGIWRNPDPMHFEVVPRAVWLKAGNPWVRAAA